jgi:hypothetical protein
MAQRQIWQFEYMGSQLAEAARAKLAHHQERFGWWSSKKEEVLSKIRSEGLEIDESLAMESPHHAKARDYQRGTQVMIRNDLQENLEECLRKLSYHAAQSHQYDGWVQVLAANSDARVRLDHEDWLFFFGKDQ